jgi:predicted Zn-dependent protease with MMP-like domain
MSIRLDREAFETIVAEALEELPEDFLQMLDNVVVLVESWPDYETRRQVGAASRYDLLGFYHGVPQTVRPHNYGNVAPDKISIYWHPIEAQCDTVDEVRETVGRVVRHEIAHHFGIDDKRLHELKAY